MRFSRVVLAIGIVLVLAFVAAVFVANEHAYGSGLNPFIILIIVVGALALLIGAGNATYGKDSHYAKAWARIRPARSVRTPPAAQPDVTPPTQSTDPPGSPSR